MAEAVIAPYENARALRAASVALVQALDGRLGRHATRQAEAAATAGLAPQVQEFLARGAAAGAMIDDIEQRTACQVLLDYWSSRLERAGLDAGRVELAGFDAALLPELAEADCPFVGLDAFRDDTHYFGREKAATSLVQRVLATRLVVVQGASGSGKSSLVMGGALPRLRDQRDAAGAPRYTVVGPFQPGGSVLQALAAALAAAGVALPTTTTNATTDATTQAAAAWRADPAQLAPWCAAAGATALLVVIDQFEEVFTLGSEADAQALAAALAALLAAAPGHRVLLTMREEFSPALDTLVSLRPLLSEQQHPRFSMKEWRMGFDDLKAAIVQPAAAVNLQFEAGLVDDMVERVYQHDTALPLLQFTLKQLWAARERNRITWQAYKAIGGSPLEALEIHADTFFKNLSKEEKADVERILRELVHVDRLLEPYRRPLRRSELLRGGSPRTADTLERLQRQDFVSVEPTVDGRDAAVEVRHEALLRNWERYRGWIQDKRERTRQRIALTESAERWHGRGESASEGLLVQWQVDAMTPLGPDLSALEQRYLQASIDALEGARREHDQRVASSARRRVLGWAVAALALSAIAVLGAFVLKQRSDVAHAERLAVQSRLAFEREAARQGKLDEAMTGALADTRTAVEGRDGLLLGEARRTLLAILSDTADLERLFVAKDRVFHAAARRNGGAPLLAYGGSRGEVHVAALAQPKGFTRNACGTATVNALVFAPGGRWLLAGCNDGRIAVLSADDERAEPAVHASGLVKVWALALSSDGRWLAAAGRGEHAVLLPLAADGRPAAAPPQAMAGDRADGDIWSLAFAPGRELLLVGDGIGGVLRCTPGDASAWSCRRSSELAGDAAGRLDAIRALAFSADGREVAVGHWSGLVERFDGELRAPIMAATPAALLPRTARGPVHSLAYFEACGRRQLAVARGRSLHYLELDAATDAGAAPGATHGCATRPAASTGDEVYAIAAGADGRLAAATRGGYTALLDARARADPVHDELALAASGPQPPRAALVGLDAHSAHLVATRPPAGAASGAALAGAGAAANAALVTLRDDRFDAAAPPLALALGHGPLRRVAGHAGARLLATIVEAAAGARVVQLWRFDERFSPPSQPALTLGAAQWAGLRPDRLAISPDAHGLVVSFAGSGRLLRVPLAATATPSAGLWFDSALAVVQEIAFDTGGEWFAAGGRPAAGGDGAQLRLWRVGTDGLQPATRAPMGFGAGGGGINEVAFGRDARGRPLLLAGSDFGVIGMWSVADGARADPLHADSRAISFVAHDAASGLLAGIDDQGTVRLWQPDAPAPAELPSFDGRPAQPGALVFGPGGRWLLASAGTLQTWDTDLASLRRKLCALVRAAGQHGADAAVPLWQPQTDCRLP